jgi:hypothetical protein
VHTISPALARPAFHPPPRDTHGRYRRRHRFQELVLSTLAVLGRSTNQNQENAVKTSIRPRAALCRFTHVQFIPSYFGRAIFKLEAIASEDSVAKAQISLLRLIGFAYKLEQIAQTPPVRARTRQTRAVSSTVSSKHRRFSRIEKVQTPGTISVDSFLLDAFVAVRELG